MKNYILIFLIFSTLLFAPPIFDDDETIDEARVISIMGESIGDNTRAILSNAKLSVYKDNVSLKSIPKELIITITSAFHLPNILIVKRKDKIVHKIVSQKARDIGFAISKKKLQVGDKIIITTSEKAKIVDMEIVK